MLANVYKNKNSGIIKKVQSLFPIIILASFVVFVPLLRCNLFFDSYLVKLWIAQFGAGILFTYFCWQILFRQGKIHINIAVDSLLLSYLLVNVLSWFLIPYPHRYPALLTLNSLIVYIFLCFFISQYCRAGRIKDFLIFLWAITAAGVCIFSIWQYLKNERVLGTLGNENFLASYIGISIPVCMGFFWRFIPFLSRPRRHVGMPGVPMPKHGSWRGRPVYRTGRGEGSMLLLGAAILLLFFTTLYLTHSRGSWFGLFWSLSSFAIIGWCPSGKRLIITMLLVLLLVILVYTPWGLSFISAQFYGDVRPAIWEGTLYMIIGKPLLGWGKGAFFIFYPQFRIQDYWITKCPTDLTIHTHNEFLQIAAETGLFGLGVFLLFVFTVLRLGIKIMDEIKEPQRYLLLGNICGIIGLLTHNLICNNLQMPSSAVFLWLILGMIISYMPSKPLGLNLPSPDPDFVGTSGRGKFRLGIFLALTAFMFIIIWQMCIKPVVSQYLFREGLQYREKEKWNPAIEKYEKAINWYPWDVEMHYRLAYAFTMDKQYDKAIDKYNDVKRFAPLYGNVHRNMGIVFMKTGEYKLAAISFLQALCVNEYDFISQVNLKKAMENYAGKPR